MNALDLFALTCGSGFLENAWFFEGCLLPVKARGRTIDGRDFFRAMMAGQGYHTRAADYTEALA